MRKIEITLVLFIITGIVLQLFSIEGARFLIMYSFLTLSSLYLFFGVSIFNDIPLSKTFKVSSYLIGWKKIIWSIIVGVLLCMASFSLVYPILNWDGNLIVVKLFNILLLPIFIISIILYLTRRSILQENILIRSGMVLCVAIIEIILMKQGILMVK